MIKPTTGKQRPDVASTTCPLFEKASDTARGFSDYVDTLECLAETMLQLPAGEVDMSLVAGALDGQPMAQLRELVPEEERKSRGAYFTSASLADRAIQPYIHAIPSASTIIDPACGAGDLLLACARHLPTSSDVDSTIDQWGRRLRGSDVHIDFVRAARARLTLLAATRQKSLNVGVLSPRAESFLSVESGDSLHAWREGTLIPEGSIVVMNPPFNRVPAAPDCPWGKGNVSLAAIFLERCIKASPLGTLVIAILPEVLRSGSNYATWRRWIEDHAVIESIDVVGEFDNKTQIDVFILRLVVETRSVIQYRPWWSTSYVPSTSRVCDFFDVRVGAVVPHRHGVEGGLRPFATARALPAWGTTDAAELPTRRFSGTTSRPPFVAVRRTSSPRDPERPVASLIVGNTAVAVENHLLVLSPKDGQLESCLRILAFFQTNESREWLTTRIRCRHLTVLSIREMPYPNHVE